MSNIPENLKQAIKNIVDNATIYDHCIVDGDVNYKDLMDVLEQHSNDKVLVSDEPSQTEWELIKSLTKDEGMGVLIFSGNPSLSGSSFAIDIYDAGPPSKDKRFFGDTVLECLQKAMQDAKAELA